MIPVLYREGDCFEVLVMDVFSVNSCIKPQGLTVGLCVPTSRSDATDLNVEHLPYNITIITYSNSDGECRNWIAPTDKYVADPVTFK